MSEEGDETAGGAGNPQSLRLTFAYEGAAVRLVQTERVAARAPPDEAEPAQPGQSGFWIELHDPGGAIRYDRVMHNPVRHFVEAAQVLETRALRHHRIETPAGGFQAVVPDMPDARTLVMFASPADAPEAPATEIARFQLVPPPPHPEAFFAPPPPILGDGSVGATTKLVDHGPPEHRWNLVILGDGYQAAELPKYRQDVQTFVDRFQVTAPFDAMLTSINIYRVDVTSTDSGADNPKHCGDDQNDEDVVRATFLDATFCVGGQSRRLLAGDNDRATLVARRAVPAVTFVLVVVNSSDYGGSGGPVAWFSTHPDSAELALHEMGHTAFGLADEYGDVFGRYTGSEPREPNVTANINPATVKWRDLMAPGTPPSVLPMANPDCGKEDPAPSPAAPGTVGLFEGGSRFHCGLFHPEFDCRMRHLSRPFCKVCERRIRETLAQFA